MSIQIGYGGSDQAVLDAVVTKQEAIAVAVIRKMDQLDTQTVSYIVNEELHGQILKQRSGKLAGSIREIPAKAEGTMVIGQVEGAGGPAWYGRLFEDGGTGPFDIVPVAKKALRFVSADGSVVFTKKVHHPGIPSKPFMVPGHAVMEPLYLSGFEEVIGEVLGA